MQEDCSLSYQKHARAYLCTKARSRMETPAFLAINLCKSDSSNISLFLAEPKGTLANIQAHNSFPLTLSLTHSLSRALSLSHCIVWIFTWCYFFFFFFFRMKTWFKDCWRELPPSCLVTQWKHSQWDTHTSTYPQELREIDEWVSLFIYPEVCVCVYLCVSEVCW